jgi:hypothetical protein|tara:strand:- start:1290 stop:1457 length:168 start_codon:yes stop_codon:yes gene_type:complete
MTENKLYEVRQLGTTGWELVDERATNLTKEQCDNQLKEYMNDGVSSERLKVFRVA